MTKRKESNKPKKGSFVSVFYAEGLSLNGNVISCDDSMLGLNADYFVRQQVATDNGGTKWVDKTVHEGVIYIRWDRILYVHERGKEK